MMYWLDERRRAPSGSLPDEDCIPFDHHHLQIVQVGDRWKLVEGTHWLMDFGAGEGNAHAALHFIRKYGFDLMCFVGRPGPSMTYFKTHGTEPHIIVEIDPRPLDVTIEEPRWRQELETAVARLAPSADLTDEAPGSASSARRFGSVTIEVLGRETSEITTVRGLTGLLLTAETEIRLGAKSSVVDVGLAHFGEPQTVVAFSGDREVTTATTSRIQRQFENVRLTAPSIDRLTIPSRSPDGAILGYVRFQPKRRVNSAEADEPVLEPDPGES